MQSQRSTPYVRIIEWIARDNLTSSKGKGDRMIDMACDLTTDPLSAIRLAIGLMHSVTEHRPLYFDEADHIRDHIIQSGLRNRWKLFHENNIRQESPSAENTIEYGSLVISAVVSLAII